MIANVTHLGISPAEVSAVLVTRGDVSLEVPLAEIALAGITDVVIFNNALELEDGNPDLGVYGRYAGIVRARGRAIYVQDDDVVVPSSSIIALLAAYEPGVLAANMPGEFRPHYPDSALVGFGAVFDRELPDVAFRRFFAHQAYNVLVTDPLFLREADRAFTILTPLRLVDLPKRDLPSASDDTRLWRQPGHVERRDRMLAMAREVRDAV